MADFPTATSASGIWTLKNVRNAVQSEQWPGSLPPPVYIEAIFVAGGGGSAGQYTSDNAVGAGGAGGGGVVVANFTSPQGTPFDFSVGAGGAKRVGLNGAGSNGSDTTFADGLTSLTYFTAKGGGGGGYYVSGVSGGCGGASGYNGTALGGNTTQTVDAYRGVDAGVLIANDRINILSSSQHGFAANSGAPTTGTGVGGGGGAGEEGHTWPDTNNGGAGGDGYVWYMDSTAYGGGGGGPGRYNNGSAIGGLGGAGGGGKGADPISGNAGDGAPGTGGGGGGGVGQGAGGNGGSGTIILYSNEPLTTINGTVTGSSVSVVSNGITYLYKYVLEGQGDLII